MLGHLSSHGSPQSGKDNGYDVASYMPLGVDGYVAEPVIAHFQQIGKYRLPLMSPSRGKIVLRRDFVGDLNSRPNVYMPQWSAPARGKMVTQVGGMVQQPMASYNAGMVNVNQFIANSDLSQTAAASFIAQKSARYTGPNLSQSGGD